MIYFPQTGKQLFYFYDLDGKLYIFFFLELFFFQFLKSGKIKIESIEINIFTRLNRSSEMASLLKSMGGAIFL